MKVPAGRVKETTAPTVAILTAAEAKVHLRIDHSTEDTYIEGLVEAAREFIENVTGRSLITRTYTAKLDDWPRTSVISLPFPPLIAVTSIKYTDEDGVTATFSSSDYTVDNYNEPGRIVLASDASWPSVKLADINGVEIIWTAGYGAAATALPQKLREAAYLLVGHFYENREAVAVAQGISVTPVPLAFWDLVMVDRVSWF